MTCPMATSQMITSKNPMNGGRYWIPFDMKMTRMVSRLMSQTRAQNIRSGTMTNAKIPGERAASSIPIYHIPQRKLMVCTSLQSAGVPARPGTAHTRHKKSVTFSSDVHESQPTFITFLEDGTAGSTVRSKEIGVPGQDSLLPAFCSSRRG